VTGVVRLTLVSHGMTDAMTAARFPDDEPLNETGRRQAINAEALAGLDIADPQARQLAGPERRARETARMLGLSPTAESGLADLDCGRWRGLALDAVRPEGLAAWLADPAVAPHGGESVVELIGRVAGWLTSVTHNAMQHSTLRITAVTHPAVIRAAILLALDSPPKSFWRIDIAPVSRTILHFRDAHWTLRL
jgi:broad specificity phosphatase PhoE